MEELYLIYINKLGEDWKGSYIYEFLFSDNIEISEEDEGEDWDSCPAAGNPTTPNVDIVIKVGKLESDLKLELIQDSDTFAVWDAIDGMIALAWEDLTGYEEYPENRVYFNFGEPLKSVEDKLYGDKDLMLDYNNIRNGKVKKEDN
jgi:hypothetical protein